ncbi:uncharacterized protein ARB_05530 [Trichophyton benhamiae CBS 112371]|uniref:Uncharacterized protein n=1 Tax=Arthroderma benhamiae (strain ATCC MYA-4681 / CBS 112371) TaxID=663331 RepID=D4AMS7_ARTBC|nr:uncharacterized protein ARB_05530 [Trichophyton benhamiae CBS 112371]EFE35488.1 hypothetical protein ARB_05530 [Trichophyton benhamiae CBS 112371]
MLGHDARTGGFLGGIHVFLRRKRKEMKRLIVPPFSKRGAEGHHCLYTQTRLFSMNLWLWPDALKISTFPLQGASILLSGQREDKDGVKRERQEAPILNPMTGQQLLSTQN